MFYKNSNQLHSERITNNRFYLRQIRCPQNIHVDKTANTLLHTYINKEGNILVIVHCISLFKFNKGNIYRISKSEFSLLCRVILALIAVLINYAARTEILLDGNLMHFKYNCVMTDFLAFKIIPFMLSFFIIS